MKIKFNEKLNAYYELIKDTMSYYVCYELYKNFMIFLGTFPRTFVGYSLSNPF